MSVTACIKAFLNFAQLWLGAVILEKAEGGENIEHPTSNAEHRIEDTNDFIRPGWRHAQS